MAGAQAAASRRKRPPGRLFTKRNDVYVGRNSNYKMQLERCESMLEKEFSEITIHGLGAAVNRAIHLALSLEEQSHGSLRVSANTSTVEVLDDFEPPTDDGYPYSEVRHTSAIHIRVYKLQAEPVAIQTTPAGKALSVQVEEKEQGSSLEASSAGVAESPVMPESKKKRRSKRIKSTELT